MLETPDDIPRTDEAALEAALAAELKAPEAVPWSEEAAFEAAERAPLP